MHPLISRVRRLLRARLLPVALAALAPVACASGVAARLEMLVPRLMADAEVPGVAIALVRGAQPLWHKGFGVMDAQTREPVGDTTIFEAASLSKPVFAYAVVKLADEGRIDLDRPLSAYLPGHYDLAADDPRLHQMTARHVLSHTTGFPNWRGLGALKIHFTPGERFSYSGEGFVYLAKTVEHITGEPLEDFMRRTVFAPLGMNDSSYAWQAHYATRKSHGHNAAGRPADRGRRVRPNAAASLHTTAADYGRFVAAVLSGTGLKASSRTMVLSPQVRLAEGIDMTGRASVTLSRSLAWGLGWGLQQSADGTSFWHWGDNGDMKAYVVADDHRKEAVVIFANSVHGLSIVPEIVAEVLPGPQPALEWLDYPSYKTRPAATHE
jgi:CubicO group peptidase (beta-lactamase class C family)